MLDAIFSTLLVAVVTALVTAILTSWVSAKVLDERMKDFKERIKRIEDYLDGLLTNFQKGGGK